MYTSKFERLFNNLIVESEDDLESGLAEDMKDKHEALDDLDNSDDTDFATDEDLEELDKQAKAEHDKEEASKYMSDDEIEALDNKNAAKHYKEEYEKLKAKQDKEDASKYASDEELEELDKQAKAEHDKEAKDEDPRYTKFKKSLDSTVNNLFGMSKKEEAKSSDSDDKSDNVEVASNDESDDKEDQSKANTEEIELVDTDEADDIASFIEEIDPADRKTFSKQMKMIYAYINDNQLEGCKFAKDDWEDTVYPAIEDLEKERLQKRIQKRLAKFLKVKQPLYVDADVESQETADKKSEEDKKEEVASDVNTNKYEDKEFADKIRSHKETLLKLIDKSVFDDDVDSKAKIKDSIIHMCGGNAIDKKLATQMYKIFAADSIVQSQDEFKELLKKNNIKVIDDLGYAKYMPVPKAMADLFKSALDNQKVSGFSSLHGGNEDLKFTEETVNDLKETFTGDFKNLLAKTAEAGEEVSDTVKEKIVDKILGNFEGKTVTSDIANKLYELFKAENIIDSKDEVKDLFKQSKINVVNTVNNKAKKYTNKCSEMLDNILSDLV